MLLRNLRLLMGQVKPHIRLTGVPTQWSDNQVSEPGTSAMFSAIGSRCFSQQL
jgi:hypothetical protein